MRVFVDHLLDDVCFPLRDWPTIPQLYVNKEFVGGCDIVTTMFREGELETLFKELDLIGDAAAAPEEK